MAITQRPAAGRAVAARRAAPTSNAADWYGRTPLWAAVEIRNLDLRQRAPPRTASIARPALRLIDGAASTRAPTSTRASRSFRRAALHAAARLARVGGLHRPDAVHPRRAVRRRGGDAAAARRRAPTRTITTFNGTTALMAAAGVNWVVGQTYSESPATWLEAVQLCLELGCDVNAVNAMGLAAVHGAANRGSDDIIELLARQRRAARRQGQGRPHADDAGPRASSWRRTRRSRSRRRSRCSSSC